MSKDSRKTTKKRRATAKANMLNRSGSTSSDGHDVDAHLVNSQPVEAQPDLEMTEQNMTQDLSRYDGVSLARAKRCWLFGEWHQLAELDVESVESNPDRDRFALLFASARQQMGEHEKAREYTRLALDWGCPPKVVAQVLIAGVHNTLGRAAALNQDDARVALHFGKSVAAIGTEDGELISHARSVREMTRMGLLPQAVALLSELSEDMPSRESRTAHSAAHAKVLSMEVDWLRDNVAGLFRQKNVSEYKAKQIQNKNNKRSIQSSQGKGDKYYGHHDLDRKLEAYLDFDGGFFVELGANDGVDQSNTLYFERERKWRGILVEPILHNFLKCKNSRSQENSIINAACVSFNYDKDHVKLAYSNLMTSPIGLQSDIDDPVSHAIYGRVYLKEGEDVVDVLAPARTLTSIFEAEHAPYLMDLLSLDVEGAELEVLEGIDHKKYRFRYLVVECRSIDKMTMYMKRHNYRILAKLSQHDYLFVGTGASS